MNVITKSVLVISSVVLAACSESEQTSNGTAPPQSVSAAEQVAQARALHAQSVELGFAWVATTKQLAAAEAALQNGDIDAAKTAATEAHALASASIAQAHTEAESWQNRMPFMESGH